MWLLIAVYLARGDAVPQMQHRQYADKETCRVVAEKYVKGIVVGQGRAFCIPIKEPLK